MTQADPQTRDFSERLIAYEAKGNKSSGVNAPLAFHAFEKLRPPLATLMGHTGFSALLMRALMLASADVAWLRAVRVSADGILQGSDELAAQLDPEEIVEGKVVLLARLLGLLVAFIGEGLTLRLMREVWPNLSLNGEKK